MNDGKILKWQDNTPDWDPFATMQLAKCQKAYNELHAKTSWISVKDRLPKDGRYLVCEKCNPIWIGVCSLRNGKWDIEVTHWMCLPSAPE